MFPDTRILGLDLYWIMVLVGVVAAFIAARLFHERAGVSFKVFRFIIIVLIGAIFLGYVFALLFQSWYNYLATGEFVWGVGATFYGGLIGGTVVFLAGYFGAGHFVFKKDKLHLREFPKVLSLVLPCVVLAHAFGRIGCLFNGCCYGKITDSALGVNMFVDGVWEKRVPVQLFEAIFLIALFFVFTFLFLKNKSEYNTSIYLISYGVWRFCIEYARDDVRGSSGIGFLSPSQLTAVILVIAGIAFIFLYKYVLKKACERAGNCSEEIKSV